MKFNFKIPRKILIGISTIALASMLFTGHSFATSLIEEELVVNNSQVYEDWLQFSDEIRKAIPMPNNYTAVVPDEKIIEYSTAKIPSIIDALKPTDGSESLQSVGASYSDKSYNLNNDAKIRVKNQGHTNECWAFSVISSFESNISLTEHNMSVEDYSERHMDYATSRRFIDGTNTKGFGRNVGEGGVAENGYNYLVNGTGAVLEQNMPFEDNENYIKLSSINQPISRIATGYAKLPSIYKTYDSYGNPTYCDANRNVLTSTQVTAYRNMIKEHIIKYGAISTLQKAGALDYYDNTATPAKAKSYYCNDASAVQDHELTIIGWDDNYSKNNFNSKHRPVHDGAYICLNTYGTENFYNGYLYVSYDDVLIEQSLLGVTCTSNKDYENLYQHDFYGPYMNLSLPHYTVGYYGSVFTTQSENEYIEYVGISSADYGTADIYINPNSKVLDVSSMTKVGSVTLVPGYNRFKVTKTKITGTQFSIVIKQRNETQFTIPVELNIPNSVFEYVTATRGTSFISIDGKDFEDIQTINATLPEGSITTADVCIKAYTTKGSSTPVDPTPTNPTNPTEPTNPTNPTNPTEPENEAPTIEEEIGGHIEPTNPTEPTNPQYNMEEEIIGVEEEVVKPTLTVSLKDYRLDGEYITNLEFGTKFSEFKKKLTTNASKIKFLTSKDVEIKDEKSLVGTGMKLVLDDKTYIFVVKGDTQGDGKFTLADLSRAFAHYMGNKEVQLKGADLKACDLNLDGKFSLGDISTLWHDYMEI